MVHDISQMKDSVFLQAFSGTNKRVPVWFMRQAGRYLPQYQAIRQTRSLDEMFRDPETAAEITCQPVDILGVDAAILFADILTLPSAMGCDIHFDVQKGPVIDPSRRLDKLHDFDDLACVAQTIRLVKKQLNGKVPLIGFAGSPFTVATYLIEGGSSMTYAKTFRFINERPQEFFALMELLTKNTILYLNLQKEAGIDVYQIFDSWGGLLPAADFERLVLPHLKTIFASVDLPSVYFIRQGPHLIRHALECGSDGVSVCHTVDLGRDLLGQTGRLIQGNLFNGWLYKPDDDLRAEVRRILEIMRSHSKFIFNLSHGVFPDVSPEKLKLIVQEVHAFKRV